MQSIRWCSLCFSEMYQVIKLLLVMPATNAYSESSFSVMRRLKPYLCSSTMGQALLNHIMLLHIYKAQLDCLDFPSIANNFVCSSKLFWKMFFTLQLVQLCSTIYNIIDLQAIQEMIILLYYYVILICMSTSGNYNIIIA